MARMYGIRNQEIGKIPVSKTVNCKEACPYGKDRAFCFPCYLKLMKEVQTKKKEKKDV